jgi:hypothetical protein
MPLEVDTARECRSGKAHRECGQTEAISGGRAGREVYRGCCGDAAVSGKAPRNRTTGESGRSKKEMGDPRGRENIWQRLLHERARCALEGPAAWVLEP